MVSLIVGATFLGIMLLWMSIRLISFYCMVSKVKKLNLYPDKANAFFKKPNIVIYRNNLLNLLLFTPIVLISLTVGIYLNLSKEIKFDIINISMIALLSLTVILNILFIVIQLRGWQLIDNNNVFRDKRTDYRSNTKIFSKEMTNVNGLGVNIVSYPVNDNFNLISINFVFLYILSFLNSKLKFILI